MADQYIDQTYVRAFFGTSLETAITGITGVSLTQQIEAATGLIQSYLRNSGYGTPDTTTDQTVMLGTLGALVETLSSIPEVSLPLPENWAEHPARIAYVGILNGDAQVTHALDKSAAVGGWKASEHRTGITDSRTQYASRKNLAGY